MKKFIIITSIFNPTEAVKKFAKLEGYHVIVVGDKKSPKTYICENVTFLSADKTYGFNIEKELPFNHYCRKMLGYLYAMKNGADIIVETDDDNIPLDNFDFPSFNGNFNCLNSKKTFVNIYSYFTEQKIWPRGLPLNYVKDVKSEDITRENVNVGIWQGLADGDPDVDAIYRLTNNEPCYFNKNANPLVLKENVVCPFNTQNTAFKKELFPLLYLPTTVTFRFTDILKGLVAQPLMWNEGYRLGYTTATVLQERNEHDYMKDFVSEIPCYIDSERVVSIATKNIQKESSLIDNLWNVYNELAKENIVDKKELDILKEWLVDCRNLST